MATKYNLKYRSFETLMADVTDDLELFEAEGFIDPSKYIKVAKKINADLGIDIQQEKEVLLEVDDYKANLPNDFYLLNFGLVCSKKSVSIDTPKLTYEEVQVDRCDAGSPKYSCGGCEIVKTNECCNNYKVVQRIETKTIEFTELDLLKLNQASRKYCSSGCRNLTSDSVNTAQIQKDWIYTSFCSGNLYLNYMGIMEDEDGNLLVLDHPLVNDYYEYSIKARILENAILNKEPGLSDIYGLTKQLEKQERTRAHLLKNMPEYSDIREAILYNRRRAYDRYYSMAL